MKKTMMLAACLFIAVFEVVNCLPIMAEESVVEAVLATPDEAKTIASTLGTHDIAYIGGPVGTCQYGPGYGLKQEVETKSGIGHAIVKMK